MLYNAMFEMPFKKKVTFCRLERKRDVKNSMQSKDFLKWGCAQSKMEHVSNHVLCEEREKRDAEAEDESVYAARASLLNLPPEPRASALLGGQE